jgi:hypothetical protein
MTDETGLSIVADTTMPEALRDVYAGIDDDIVDRCEHERIGLVNDTFAHLQRVHAMLAPLGLFRDWCRAVGINDSTARHRVLDKEASVAPRRHDRLLPLEDVQTIPPGDEPVEYEVVDQYATEAEDKPEPAPLVSRNTTSVELDRIAQVNVYVEAMLHSEMLHSTLNDEAVAAWIHVVPRYRRDEVLRRLDFHLSNLARIQQALLDARTS